MKIILFLLFFCTILFSCTKSESATHARQDLLDRYNTLVWHLTNYSVAGVSQALTASQQHYTKKYVSDGIFSTSDGFTGTWNLIDFNTLEETYTNFPAGGSASQTYTIASLNSTTLILQYINNGSTITTSYTAGN